MPGPVGGHGFPVHTLTLLLLALVSALAVLQHIGDENYGYNAATNTFEDMVKAGVIDPMKVRWGCCTGGGAVLVGPHGLPCQRCWGSGG